MEYGLWSGLPDELVERVLPYLPVPNLCRFCSVCKRWNSLICTAEFGILCVENASKGVGTGACLVVKICAYNSRTGHTTEIQSWSILDLNSRRWYNVKHELPKGYDYDCRTVGVDGGLVCTFVDAFTDEQRRTSTIDSDSEIFNEPQILIISNLLGGAIKVLPNPPLVRINLPFVNLKLFVDNRSHMTYKVVLIRMDYIPGDARWMCVYESSTNQWRIAPTPPNEYDLYRSIQDNDTCSVCFQGLLYVFIPPSSNLIYGHLCSYNFLEDAWQDTGVRFGKIPYCMLNLCDLVVSDNRLFMMTDSFVDYRVKMSNEKEVQIAWPLKIREISLADKAHRTVVRLTPTEVYQKFCIEPDMHRQYSIRAFGYDRSILLMCQATGKVIEYNLVTGLWETLPPNPVESLHLSSIPHYERRYVSRSGKLMSGFLHLPNTPL